jgi:hypothetical protein
MGMGEQDQFYSQFLRRDAVQHFVAIRAGIERDRLAGGRIPREISVHRHVAINAVELRQPFDFLNRFRHPLPARQFSKSSRIQI